MEQNNGKFRLRLNLFDGIVLLVALALGAFLAWSALKPDTSTAQTTPQSHTLQYTLRFQRWPEGTSGLIEAGDLLVDTVKNYELGRVVSFETVPAQTLLLSQTDKKYVLSTVQGYEDILVTVESPCTISQEGDLILGGGYALRVGETAYIRSEGYMASGPVVAIDREGIQ